MAGSTGRFVAGYERAESRTSPGLFYLSNRQDGVTLAKVENLGWKH